MYSCVHKISIKWKVWKVVTDDEWSTFERLHSTFRIPLGDIFKLSQFAKWIKHNELRGDDKITVKKIEVTMIHDTERLFVPKYNMAQSNYVSPFNNGQNNYDTNYNARGPSHAGRGGRHNNYVIDNRKRNATTILIMDKDNMHNQI